MKLSATDASLLSAAERNLVTAKGPWHVKDLVKAIQRTRALRDKQADLLRRQSIETAQRTGSKSGRSGGANARTAAKGRIFERALRHLEAALAAIDAQSSEAVRQVLDAQASKPAAARPVARKSATGRAVRNKKSAGKPAVRKSAADKGAAGTASTAKAKAPARKAAPKGPLRKVSSKARIALPREVAGPSAGQRASTASRRSRAKKSR
jgi:hypothetical protein